MKTLGLLGGMSWESTAIYYRLLNQTVKARLVGLPSARVLLRSVDFHAIEALQRAGDWHAEGASLARDALSLQRAGAQALVLCTNTMHRVAPAIAEAVQIPHLHIADATARAVLAAGCTRVGLLGARFTMEQDFYRGRFEREYGIEVLVPAAEERAEVHRVIYDELCLGRFETASRERYREVIAGLEERGAQAVVLGCTEIGLLVDASDATEALIDTTREHALAAVEWALTD